MLPDDIANYIYRPKTGNTNLQRHLYLIYPEEYNKAVFEHKWTYKLSTESHNPSIQDVHNTCDCDILSFSPVVFLEHLIRFIIANDQVSLYNLTFFQTLTSLQSIHVVECPEFQCLCMVLCGTLVENAIPCHDKMREAVISQWQDSFEQLKMNLLVGMGILSFCFISCLQS